MIKNIVKRDGRVVSYDDGKIVRAIQKAMDAAGHTAKAGEAAIIAAASRIADRLFTFASSLCCLFSV